MHVVVYTQVHQLSGYNSFHLILELNPQTIAEISMEIAKKDNWESVKFLADKLDVALVTPEKHRRHGHSEWYIMQLLIQWVHQSNDREDEPLSKLLARRLIECYENRAQITGYADNDSELPCFKRLARQVDIQG